MPVKQIRQPLKWDGTEDSAAIRSMPATTLGGSPVIDVGKTVRTMTVVCLREGKKVIEDYVSPDGSHGWVIDSTRTIWLIEKD